MWPINMTGPTNVVFATGNTNLMGRHSSNRSVSGEAGVRGERGGLRGRLGSRIVRVGVRWCG
jgi:hypothetical protein